MPRRTVVRTNRCRRSRGGAITVGLALLIWTSPLALAVVQDWYVDVNAPLCSGGIGTEADPFCDIMDAVAAAADGDTIHIAPGTYLENVGIFQYQDLELIGTGGQLMTIVDAAGAGRAVTVMYSNVRMRGLTLTGGAVRDGGGLFADDSSVMLLECRISGNAVGTSAGSAVGGGLFAVHSSVTLVGSTISGNAANASTGGGIIAGAFGGGLGSYDGELTLVDSMVTANSSSHDGGAILAGGSLTLINSTVAANTSTSGTGGIVSYASLALESTRVSGNSGANILWFQSGPTDTITIENSTVIGSTIGVQVFGGYAGNSLTVTNSTLSGNSAGGICIDSLGAEVSNCVLWNNGPNPLLLTVGSSANVEYSLIEGGWPGVGNIDAAPLFVDAPNGDFRLTSGSPCIDAGNNLAVPPGLFTDLDGKRRFIDDPLTLDTGHPGGLWPIVDMGAYEFGNDPPRKVRRR